MNHLKSHNHCKFLLQYHMIFVTKYRRNILTPIREQLLDCMNSISRKCDFEIIKQEIDKDHIHFLIKSYPTLSPTRYVECLNRKAPLKYGDCLTNILENSTGRRIHCGRTDISYVQLEMHLKIQLDDTSKRREDRRFILATKDDWVFSAILIIKYLKMLKRVFLGIYN